MLAIYLAPSNCEKVRTHRRTPIFSQPNRGSQLRMWIDEGKFLGRQKEKKLQEDFWVRTPAGWALVDGPIEKICTNEAPSHETSILAKKFDEESSPRKIKNVSKENNGVIEKVPKYEEKQSPPSYVSSRLAKKFDEQTKQDKDKEKQHSGESKVCSQKLLPVAAQKSRFEATFGRKASVGRRNVEERGEKKFQEVKRGRVSDLVKKFSSQ